MHFLHHQQKLVGQASKFLRNVIFSVHFFLHPELGGCTKKETFGLKSNMDTPNVPELTDFEDKVIYLITNIKFKPKSSIPKFQKKLIKSNFLYWQ